MTFDSELFHVLGSHIGMKRFSNSLIALLVAFVVLFSQLAVAMHPCPQLAKAIASTQVADDCECPPEELASSAMCKKHCENDKQNLSAHPTTADSTFASTAFLIVVRDPISAESTSARRPINIDTPPTPPPPHLKNANLRI
jgi:hypothetical protein